MVEVFARFGLDGRLPASGLSVDSPLEERHAFAAMSEEGMGAVFEVLAAEPPAPDGVATTTSTIPASTATTSRCS